jgi:hypothetical protein
MLTCDCLSQLCSSTPGRLCHIYLHFYYLYMHYVLLTGTWCRCRSHLMGRYVLKYISVKLYEQDVGLVFIVVCCECRWILRMHLLVL